MSANRQERVSVIIPARNEEVNIARVVRSLANQQGIREILVVDDQSSDRTPEILADLTREIPLLRTLHAVSPLATLARGYAIVKDEQGRILRNAADAPAGTLIDARLAHGHIRAKVQDP